MNFIYEDNRIYLEDETGKTVAEVTFPNISENVVDINHTFVDDSLRGKGIASELIKAVAEKLKKENKKAHPTCSYAVKWFEKNKDYEDIYINDLY